MRRAWLWRSDFIQAADVPRALEARADADTPERFQELPRQRRRLHGRAPGGD